MNHDSISFLDSPPIRQLRSSTSAQHLNATYVGELSSDSPWDHHESNWSDTLTEGTAGNQSHPFSPGAFDSSHTGLQFQSLDDVRMVIDAHEPDEENLDMLVAGKRVRTRLQSSRASNRGHSSVRLDFDLCSLYNDSPTNADAFYAAFEPIGTEIISFVSPLSDFDSNFTRQQCGPLPVHFISRLADSSSSAVSASSSTLFTAAVFTSPEHLLWLQFDVEFTFSPFSLSQYSWTILLIFVRITYDGSFPIFAEYQSCGNEFRRKWNWETR